MIKKIALPFHLVLVFELLPINRTRQPSRQKQSRTVTARYLFIYIFALISAFSMHSAKAQSPVVQDNWWQFKNGTKFRGIITASNGDYFAVLEGSTHGGGYISRRKLNGTVDTTLFSFFSDRLGNPIYDSVADAFYFIHQTGNGSGPSAVFDSVFVAKVSNASTTPTINLRWTYLNSNPYSALKKDGAGNLYQLEYDKIYKITTTGVATLWSQPYHGQFPELVDLAFDANGNGYTFNRGQYKYLTKITPDGLADTLWAQIHDVDFTVASENQQPLQIEVSGNYVYTANSLAISGSINTSGVNRFYIHKTPLSGIVNANYNLADSFDIAFNNSIPSGYINDIKADAHGNLYFSFYNLDTVVTYSAAGIIANPALLLPKRTMSERTDGEDFPLFIDQNGDIYISAHNDTVQSVTMNMPPFGPVTYQFPLPRRLLLKVGNLSPLPIIISNFTAIKVNNTAKLEWSSSLEINAKEYQVERSIDGSSFQQIGTVAVKANIGEYQFADYNLPTDKLYIYYRLKLVDNDGRNTYSTVKEITNNINIRINVYPNPVNDILTLSGAAIGTNILLTDIDGKVLQKINITQTSLTVDMSKYCRGIYLLKTSGAIKKIIKE